MSTPLFSSNTLSPLFVRRASPIFIQPAFTLFRPSYLGLPLLFTPYIYPHKHLNKASNGLQLPRLRLPPMPSSRMELSPLVRARIRPIKLTAPVLPLGPELQREHLCHPLVRAIPSLSNAVRIWSLTVEKPLPLSPELSRLVSDAPYVTPQRNIN